LFAALLSLALAQAPKSTSGLSAEFLVFVQRCGSQGVEPGESHASRENFVAARTGSKVSRRSVCSHRQRQPAAARHDERDTATRGIHELVASNEQREKTITDKPRLWLTWKRRFKEGPQCLDAVSDTQLSKSIKVLAPKPRPRGVYMIIANHVSEHMASRSHNERNERHCAAVVTAGEQPVRFGLDLASSTATFLCRHALNRVLMSSACSSSLARISSMRRRVVGSFSPK